MKERFANEILNRMSYLQNSELEHLAHVLAIVLNDYEISMAKNEIVEWSLEENYKLMEMFLVAKKVEGCTERTIRYYRDTDTHFLDSLRVPLREVTTNHIRYFIAQRDMVDHVSKTTQDNELRNLRTFFAWLTAEEYIARNPCLRIKAIRGEKKVKKAFSEMELEKLRSKAVIKRDRAILEVLLSTGCRVAGLVGMNRSDIEEDSIIVREKGKKERRVFFNTKARFALQEYLKERTDANDALFVTLDKPHDRLKIPGVEIVIRELGRSAGVPGTHPHRFRRTCATLARRRGMPLEDIQMMLGHENIATTMIYVSQDEDSLQSSHKKYVT